MTGTQTRTVTGVLSTVQVPSLTRTQYCVVFVGLTVFCPSPDPEAIRRLFVPVPAYHSTLAYVPRVFDTEAVRVAFCPLAILVPPARETASAQTVTVAVSLVLVQVPRVTCA